MKWFSRKSFFISLTVSVLITASACLYCIAESKKPYLTIIGPVLMGDGIGRQAVELIHALHNVVEVGFIPTQIHSLKDIPSKIMPFISHPNKTLGKVIIYEEPLPTQKKTNKSLKKHFHGPKKSSQIRIAYSMFESSRIPAHWAEALNTFFDLVAVPDEFLVEAYQQSGVTIPIFVLPLGLEIDRFLEQPIKSSQNKPFCFINGSSLISRKNHEGLIKAFYQAFGDDPNVLLLMNYRYKKGDVLEKVTELLTSLHVKNIILKNEELDNEQYLHFLKKGDVLISLTKGEGFSIQPREAMALGLPVIISDNTAHKTILKTSLACGVSCPSRNLSYNEFLHCVCGEEYIPDIDEAVQALRKLYENYDQYLTRAEERREWARNYKYENLQPLYHALVKPSRVLLSDHNEVTKDTLMTNSVALYKKYKKLTQPSSCKGRE